MGRAASATPEAPRFAASYRLVVVFATRPDLRLTTRQMGTIFGFNRTSARATLDRHVDSGLLTRSTEDGQSVYSIGPLMASMIVEALKL